MAGTEYLWLKFFHILVAMIALGTSAGLGIVLEFFGSNPNHGAFILRVVGRMTALVVLPGYVLMLATGVWMASLGWGFTARWIQLALALWVAGVAVLGWCLAAVRKQERLHAAGALASTDYRRAAFASRLSGGAFGAVVVATLVLMVFKP